MKNILSSIIAAALIVLVVLLFSLPSLLVSLINATICIKDHQTIRCHIEDAP